MKLGKASLLAVCALTLGGIAFAQQDHRHDRHGGTGSTNPQCAPALKATKQAATQLDQCVNQWKRDRKPGDHQPSDNCSNEYNNFSTAIGNEGTNCTPAS